MNFFSKDEYTNDKLSRPIFKRFKERRLKNALKHFGNFDDDVEVFNIDDEKAYVKDSEGTIYEFLLDFFSYGNEKRQRDLFLLKILKQNTFALYDYDSFNLKGKGYYLDDGAVITEYCSIGDHPKRYTLEKNDEKYFVSINYPTDFLKNLQVYCFNHQDDESFASFLEFCKGVSIEYCNNIIMGYSSNNTNIKIKLNFGEVEECSLNINGNNDTNEVISLTYQDGKLTEDYKVIRKITEDELSDESKNTVNSVKRLIKS